MAWHDSPLIGLDFETTGVDPLNDLPVQVALVWCDGSGGRQSAVFLVDPGMEIPEAAIAVHGISTERARREGRSLCETAYIVHRELAKAARENIPLVAMNASFDVTIAESLFARVGLSDLSWHLVIDPLVIDRRVDKYRKGKRRLDALCETYGIRLEAAHDAGHDAEAAISLAREIGRRWPEAGCLDAEELTICQRAWHHAWAEGFNDWCVREGRPELSPADYLWPVRAPAHVAAATGERDLGSLQSPSEARTMSTSSGVDRGLTMARRMATSPR
ncbi:MAG: exonuclease domain-containing protein [Acidimicrobiales bacterium]